MKIWIKLLIGSIVGVLLGYYLPLEGTNTRELFSFLSDLMINIGRYGIFPLVFFGLTIGTYELRQEKRVLRTYVRIIVYLLITTALLVIIGAVSVVLISPERIPIIIEESVQFSLPDVKEVLLKIFPKNLFLVFGHSGDFMFPLFFLAFFLGLNFAFDRLITRPAVQVFDSLSRIFYHINSFIIEVIGIGMIVLAAFFTIQIKTTAEIELFKQLITIFIIDSAVVIFGIYPALLYLFGDRENPYKWLYGVFAAAITGFISRDSYFSLSMLTKHGKENLGIPRKIGSASFPLFAIFGKAGTAMVTSATFLVILKSYSSLGIEFSQVLWVMGYTFLISFTLSTVPGLGAFVALSVLCSLYGNGVEEGYLIIQPIAPLMVSFGVLVDVITSAMATLFVARHEKAQKEVEVQDYI
jgi:Na+/H+-dicarboxylate symporter